MAIKPSLIQWPRSMSSPASPRVTEAWVAHSASYEGDHGEFAQARATAVAPTRRIALPDSVARKRRNGPDSCPESWRRRVWPEPLPVVVTGSA